MAEDKSGSEAETPFVHGVAAGMKKYKTTGSSDNAVEPADKPEDEATSSHNSIEIAPSAFKPGDYVQWESQGVLRMAVAKRLSHFSDDGNFAFIEGSATGIPVEELIAADLLPQSAGESEIVLSAAPESDEHPKDNSILSTTDHANGITRLLGDSLAVYTKDKQFSQARLDELIKLYQVGLGQDLMKYRWRCGLVYAIHKETAKSGCKGLFSATLRRIQLADSTAYDMIERHRVRIGEIKDKDATDLRDTEEGEEGKKSEKVEPRANCFPSSFSTQIVIFSCSPQYHKSSRSLETSSPGWRLLRGLSLIAAIWMTSRLKMFSKETRTG